MSESLAWAKAQLMIFVQQAKPVGNGFAQFTSAGDPDAVVRQAVVVEAIFDRYVPGWRSSMINSTRYRWHGHNETAQRVSCLRGSTRRDARAPR